MVYKGLFARHDKALSDELEEKVINDIEDHILSDFEKIVLQNTEEQDKGFVENTILQSIEEAIAGIPKQVFFK